MATDSHLELPPEPPEPDETGAIYALFDPRDPEVLRVVSRSQGHKTKAALSKRAIRFASRHKAGREPNAVKDWLNELAEAGIEPGVRFLERDIPVADLAGKRRYWVKRLVPFGSLLSTHGYGSGATRKGRLAVSLSAATLEELDDALARTGEFGSRTDFVRARVEEYIDEHDDLHDDSDDL